MRKRPHKESSDGWFRGRAHALATPTSTYYHTGEKKREIPLSHSPSLILSLERDRERERERESERAEGAVKREKEKKTRQAPRAIWRREATPFLPDVPPITFYIAYVRYLLYYVRTYYIRWRYRRRKDRSSEHLLPLRLWGSQWEQRKWNGVCGGDCRRN